MVLEHIIAKFKKKIKIYDWMGYNIIMSCHNYSINCLNEFYWIWFVRKREHQQQQNKKKCERKCE